jgi:hypothetical protein
MASASRENPPADSTRVGGHSRGALSDLRLPRLTQVVIALAVTMPVLWLLSRPRRGFSGPDMGTIALEALLTWATLFGAAVAVVLAVIHIVRPAAALAAVYSTLALCVILGHGSLLVLGYWQNVPERDGHYSLSVAVPLVFASVAALIPAVIAGMVNRRAN